MPETTFNTPVGAVVERHLLVLYLNTGTGAAPAWSPVGKRVEDSSMEFDWGEETKNDIFGKTYTTMKKPTITQTFEPCELDSGDVAQQVIWEDAIKNQNVAALTNKDMMVAHLYSGTANTAVFAERYSACAVKPTGLGGSAIVGMPIDVTFGGDRTIGSAAVADGKVTFTAATQGG